MVKALGGCVLALCLMGMSPVTQGPPQDRPPGVTIIMTVTAYCHDERQPKKCDSKPKEIVDGITASGKRVRVGFCAADWSIFPRGTILYVPDYGRCVVEDQGGDIKGRKLDVFMASPKAARAWGVRAIPVRLIRWGMVED